MNSLFEESVKQAVANRNCTIGNDLVFLPNFQLSLTEEFKGKAYTQAELDYCNQFRDSLLRYASTWAAKEAVYKAVKQLDESIAGWKKIEITRKRNAGEPVVTLHGRPDQFKISLTISHDGDYVWAIALVDTESK